MTEYVWPNGVRMSDLTWRHISNTDASVAPLSGSMQTVARPGDRLGCVVRVSGATGSEIRKLRALAGVLRGRSNRAWIQDLSIAGRRAGSFSASELLTNQDLSSGTTGWSASGTSTTLSASDGVLRVNVGAATSAIGAYQSIVLTAYVPYALRAMSVAGRGLSGQAMGPIAGDSVANFSDNSGQISRGYLIASGVAPAGGSGIQYPVLMQASSGMLAGDYLLLPFSSMARCALVDGGGNLVTYSNTFTDASWTKATGVTAGPYGPTDPTGGGNAQYIQESDTTNREHYISKTFTVTSAAQDITLSVYCHALTRSWLLLRLSEGTGVTYAYAWFNVSTGAVGSINTGANWTNIRQHIVSHGGGWYRCTITARKTNAATAMGAFIQTSNADATPSYAGTASAIALIFYEVSLNLGSVPTRGSSTTSAVAAASTQSGPGVYLKGLPASQSGLLLVGDQCEVDKQIKFQVADLNSDASGLGYLQVESPFARAVADNTPIIVEKPMAKFVLVSDAEYEIRPGIVSDFEFTFEQDLAS